MSFRSIWFRLIVFALCFLGVVQLISSLKSDGISPEFLGAIGLPSGGSEPTSSNSKTVERFTWCRQPVVEMALGDSHQPIRFDGQKWKQGRKELDMVAVESWLLAHCRVKVQEWDAQGEGMPVWSEALRVKFEDGSEGSLFRYRGWFRWKEATFQSLQLTKALGGLTRLEAAKK